MANAELNVPTFVKGEPGFAGKLNELAAAVLQLAKDLNGLKEAVETLKKNAPATKPVTTRKASTKAE